MSWLYLAAIVVSTLGMGALDHRWRLVAFARAGRTLAVLAVGLAFFLTWDLVAIGLDIYDRGRSPAMTGIELAPDLPLEELFFIVFLCYTTLVVHGLAGLVVRERTQPPAQREVAR